MAPTCELYLRLGGDELPSVERLEDIIRLGMPAAILIGAKVLETQENANRLEEFVALIKRQNIAVLFEDNAQLAVRLQADGVHLNGGLAAVDEARQLLGEEAYIGVSSPLSRHEAMSLAEAGPSYLAFGGDAGTDAAGFDALLEMTEWWAGIIELPCAVWLSADADEMQIRELIEAGADYLAPEVTAIAEPDRLALIGALMKATG